METVCSNPIQDEGSQTPAPPSPPPPPNGFSPVTSTNVGISPKSFWLWLFCWSQIIELEPRAPLKKIDLSGQALIKLRLWWLFSRSARSYQTFVTWTHLQYNLMQVMKLTEDMTLQLLFQKTFISRKSRAANIADIIKIATMVIKTTFKETN